MPRHRSNVSVAGLPPAGSISHGIYVSPSNSIDFDLHKYAIRNGFQMEKRTFPCISEEYLIEVTDKSRKDEIVDVLIENFLNDETLVKSLRANAHLSKEEEQDLYEDERHLMESVVDDGTVLVALHRETNRIAGVLVVLRKDRETTKDEYEHAYTGEIKSRVIKDFFVYMDMIERDLKLFERYPDCQAYAGFELIGINKQDRRKGLGQDLYNAGLTVAEEMPNVSVVYGIYTSLYSRTLAERIGKKVISKVDVTEFKDADGKPVFQDTAPHNEIALMAMEI